MSKGNLESFKDSHAALQFQMIDFARQNGGLNHFLPDCTLRFSPCLSSLLHPRIPLADCARLLPLGSETSCFPTFLPSN
jgi:hypothetical protein